MQKHLINTHGGSLIIKNSLNLDLIIVYIVHDKTVVCLRVELWNLLQGIMGNLLGPGVHYLLSGPESPAWVKDCSSAVMSH